MDTSEDNIEKCEKAKEIQKLWPIPNGAQFPDTAFTRSAIVFKREIKSKETSHFWAYDYTKENPHWIKAMGGHLGIIKAQHSSNNNPLKFGGGFCSTDKTFPAKEEVIEISGEGHISKERWLPKEWCIWLPYQDQLQKMSGLPWRAFDMLCLEMASKGGSAEHIETKEQVAIMAVMNLLYNKVWQEQDWVAEKLE